MSGASIINYKSTLVLYGIRTKHLSNNLDHVQSNTSRPIAGNYTPFENRLKPFYLRKDYLGLLQLFKSVKSDSASNLEDKMETRVCTRVFHRKHRLWYYHFIALIF